MKKGGKVTVPEIQHISDLGAVRDAVLWHPHSIWCSPGHWMIRSVLVWINKSIYIFALYKILKSKGECRHALIQELTSNSSRTASPCKTCKKHWCYIKVKNYLNCLSCLCSLHMQIWENSWNLCNASSMIIIN